ncbi:MAG: hypothetical protein FWG52_05715 [Proteobacteria bacterium]|nr:hypothetical protein [Pseudomonadota bacterium]
MTSSNRVFESPRSPGLGTRPVRHRQRGQALTEVALSALLVLIPTFIFGWALYAYGQARTSSLNGARYAAWERTVWHEGSVSGAQAAVRSTSEIERHMVERFFGKADAVIRSTYTASNMSGNADLASFYSVHNGDKVVDTERSAGGASAGQAARPALRLWDKGDTTSTIGEVYGLINSIMSRLGAEEMKLEDQGLYVAEVNTKLNAIRHVKVLEDLNLNIKQRAAVVTDSWSAGGKEHEEAIVKPMVPFAALGDFLEPLIDILQMLDEGTGGWKLTPFGEFVPGCIRGDVVPVNARIGGALGNNEINYAINSGWGFFLDSHYIGTDADTEQPIYLTYLNRQEKEKCTK